MWCLLSPQDPISHLTRLTSHNFCLFRPYCGIAPARSPSSGSAKRSAPCLSNSCERAVAWDTVYSYAMHTDCKVLVFCRIWTYCPCFQSQIVWLSSSFHSCATALVVVVQILQQVFFLLPWSGAFCNGHIFILDQNWRHFPSDWLAGYCEFWPKSTGHDNS